MRRLAVHLKFIFPDGDETTAYDVGGVPSVGHRVEIIRDSKTGPHTERCRVKDVVWFLDIEGYLGRSVEVYLE
jgi:hypothetical protein